MSHVEPERGNRQPEGTAPEEPFPAVPSPWSAQDEFAARAMQGILAFTGIDAEPDSIETLALLAYDIAEAMMKQREKRP